MNPKTNFDGVGEFTGGEYGDISLDGVYSCSGDLKAKDVSINGVFSSKGSFEADSLSCNGVSDFNKSIKVKKLDVSGVLNVKDDGKIEADEIFCTGAINAKSEINADIIEADGYINAKEIVGDHVIIKSRMGFLVKIFPSKLSTVDFIEATNIELRGVRAQTVSGHDVLIGPKCTIDKLNCDGILRIDPDATVNTITGNYTMQS